MFYKSFASEYGHKAAFVAFAFFSFFGSLWTILLIRDQEKYIRFVDKNFYWNVQEIRGGYQGMFGKIMNLKRSINGKRSVTSSPITMTNTNVTFTTFDDTLLTELTPNDLHDDDAHLFYSEFDEHD